MSNKIFRMAFPLACGWTPATTLRIGMKRVLGGLLALALPLLLAMPPVSAASTLRFDDGFNMLDFDDNGATFLSITGVILSFKVVSNSDRGWDSNEM